MEEVAWKNNTMIIECCEAHRPKGGPARGSLNATERIYIRLNPPYLTPDSMAMSRCQVVKSFLLNMLVWSVAVGGGGGGEEGLAMSSTNVLEDVGAEQGGGVRAGGTHCIRRRVP